MIINLRGTNGSGKSTIVRSVMSLFGDRVRFAVQYDPPKKRPIGYEFPSGCRHLFVVGHYEIANGGVDTLPSLDAAYDLVRRYDDRGYDVLYEGKNMSDGTRRVSQLIGDGRDVRVVLIEHSLGECVAAVRQRGHSISEKTIERLYHKSRREILMLERAGVKTWTLPRDETLGQVREWLGL